MNASESPGTKHVYSPCVGASGLTFYIDEHGNWISSGKRGNKYVCPVCGLFAWTSYQDVVRHIELVHSFNSNFHITCSLVPHNCPKTYTKYESFRPQVYRKHREELKVSTVYTGELEQDDENYAGSNAGGNTVHDPLFDQEDEDLISQSAPTVDMSVKRAAAMFILKSMEERKISQVSV